MWAINLILVLMWAVNLILVLVWWGWCGGLWWSVLEVFGILEVLRIMVVGWFLSLYICWLSWVDWCSIKKMAAPGRAHVRGLSHVSRPGPAGSGGRKLIVPVLGGFGSSGHLYIPPFSETYD